MKTIYQRITEGLSGASRAYKKAHRAYDKMASEDKPNMNQRFGKAISKIMQTHAAVPKNPNREKARQERFNRKNQGR